MADAAKKMKARAGKDEGPVYPSPCGSHRSMVDQEATELMTSLLSETGKVVCKDGNGFYITEAFRLDCGLADPNRSPTEDWRDLRLHDHGLEKYVKDKFVLEKSLAERSHQDALKAAVAKEKELRKQVELKRQKKLKAQIERAKV